MNENEIVIDEEMQEKVSKNLLNAIGTQGVYHWTITAFEDALKGMTNLNFDAEHTNLSETVADFASAFVLGKIVLSMHGIPNERIDEAIGKAYLAVHVTTQKIVDDVKNGNPSKTQVREESNENS